MAMGATRRRIVRRQHKEKLTAESIAAGSGHSIKINVALPEGGSHIEWRKHSPKFVRLPKRGDVEHTIIDGVPGVIRRVDTSKGPKWIFYPEKRSGKEDRRKGPADRRGR